MAISGWGYDVEGRATGPTLQQSQRPWPQECQPSVLSEQGWLALRRWVPCGSAPEAKQADA